MIQVCKMRNMIWCGLALTVSDIKQKKVIHNLITNMKIKCPLEIWGRCVVQWFASLLSLQATATSAREWVQVLLGAGILEHWYVAWTEAHHQGAQGTPVSFPPSPVHGFCWWNNAEVNAFSALSAELSHVAHSMLLLISYVLHVICTQLTPGHLICMYWRQSTVQWGDCTKSQIAPFTFLL